jgi:tetratricopeptide (TPR) repeat protein
MCHAHPPEQWLLDFASGHATATQRSEVVRHLLSGCSECRARAGDAWAQSGSAEGKSAHCGTSLKIERVLQRARRLGAGLLEERRQAQELLPGFLSHPPTRRSTIAGNSRRLRTYAFCEALLDRCFHQLFNDPADALALADSAVALSARLPVERYGAALVHDMRGRCLGYLANARRVCEDFRGADQAFAEAAQQLQHGTGDPLEKAQLSWFEGHLRIHQRRFKDAHRRYDEAIALYRRVGDRHLEGRALGDKASALSSAGEFEAAIRLRQEALGLLDQEREPRMWLIAQHNLAHDLSQSGRAAEALEKLEPLRRQHEHLGDTMHLLRFRWLEGKILAELARCEEAEAAFLDTRSRVVAKGLAYDVGLVSLDLAALYAKQNRTTEMKRLAAEMLPIFQSLGIHREAIAAVLVFQQAAEMEAVSTGLIQELAAYFQRASKEPGLRFRGHNGSD